MYRTMKSHSSGTIHLTTMESDQTGHQFVQAALQNYSMSSLLA